MIEMPRRKASGISKHNYSQKIIILTRGLLVTKIQSFRDDLSPNSDQNEIGPEKLLVSTINTTPASHVLCINFTPQCYMYIRYGACH